VEFEAALSRTDPAAAKRVRAMLASRGNATERLNAAIGTQSEGSALPDQLGGFRLIGELGRGGMGIVALAERQLDGVIQQVAIKWLPGAQIDAARRARFQLEREVVARLEHPGIARLIDGSESHDPELWYAMERVRGVPIDQHCRERALDLRARVQVLLGLCQALDYAHRHLVLHRDIKPGNVLVNADGQTKLIDFGIAKTLSEDSPELTAEQTPLTPRYAAPEQLRGERPSTAADQWQLAALAFELLCGSPLRNEIGIESASRRALAAPAEHLAACGLDAAALARSLRGDLDAILGKALSDDPGARYASVDAFASDLHAWLDVRPVAVRRHERWYAGVRFARQHRWALGFASVALCAVVSAGVIALVLGERAREQARVAERTSELLLDVFLDQPANSFSLASMSLADFFSRVVDLSIQSEDLPVSTRSRLLKTLSIRSMEIGAEKASVLSAQEATRLVEQQFGPDSVEVARALDHQTRVTLHGQGRAAASAMQSLLERSGRIHESTVDGLTEDRLAHLRARMTLADAENDNAAMIRWAEQAVALAASSKNTRLDVLLHFKAQLAGSYSIAGQNRDAMQEADAALAMADEALIKQQTPHLNELRTWLARSACEMRARTDAVRALPLCLELLVELEAAGAVNSHTGSEVLFALSMAYGNHGEPEKAMQSYLRTKGVIESVFGEAASESVELNRVRMGIGREAFKLGRFAEAAEAQRAALEFVTARRGATHPQVLNLRMELVESLLASRRTGDAREWMDATLDVSALADEPKARWHELLARVTATEGTP
jgi:hypothetical protein